VQVECRTATGRNINFCGHGLLSAARYWHDHSLAMNALLMGGRHYDYVEESGVGWMASDAIPLVQGPAPEWTEQVFGQCAAASALAGGDGDYLVLEWPENSDIAQLPRPGAQLADHTKRAVIVSCMTRGSASLAGEDIQLRYFAPQHGVEEDVATGSAMRVLASYWQARGLGEQLQGLQRSSQGGWLLSRITDDKVWVGGIARPQESAA